MISLNSNTIRYTMENTNRPTAAEMAKRAPVPVVAITAGDSNGVGYEVIIKTLTDPHMVEICTPVIYGNLSILKKHMQTLDKDYQTLAPTVIQKASEAKPGHVYIINCYPDNTPLKLGESTPEGGRASLLSLQHAVADIKAGHAQALVTAPINKENIQSEQFTYSGHTEYLTHEFGQQPDGATTESLMMMVSQQMRVALVSNHVSVAKIVNFVSEERILRKLRTLSNTLTADFAIRGPRIAVLALNPHAGDKGLIGKEEQSIIAPAVKKANEQGILAFGPYSADGFFGSGMYTHFDAVLGMYHDQVLIPFKSLDMDGVNYTAGLPVVRTSPDHGTAYDLVGKNKASHASFANALYMAIDLLRQRAVHAEITANPVPYKEYKEKERSENRPRFFVPPTDDKKPAE